jgi:acylphosphatase
MDKVAFKAYVAGAVQGVGFRYFTYQEANRLELSGYVKNLADGQVEVFAEGLKNHLDQFLDELTNTQLKYAQTDVLDNHLRN